MAFSMQEKVRKPEEMKSCDPKNNACADSYTFTPPRTPTALTTSAHKLFSEIQDIYITLSNLSSLSPGNQVDDLLTQLVSLCIRSYSSEFTSYFFSITGVAELCEKLRPLCAIAEGELEKYWSGRMIKQAWVGGQSRTNLLDSFPYYQNYIDLSRLECSTLEAFMSTPPRKITFIGSGPLPLTSLCMLDRYPEASVHNIDRDASALQASHELCVGLGYVGMSFACEDITKDMGRDWNECDVVFLAALVGIDTMSKIAIMESLARKLRPETLIVARSAQGLRSILYPTLELSAELDKIGLEVLVEVHPWTKVVNSVVVLRVKER